METATQAALRIDIKRNRAIQYATMLIFELSSGGYIADACRHDAIHHLANLFYREDVEITTAEQRRVASAVEQGADGK